MEDLGAKFGGPRERLDYGPIAKHVGRKFDFLLRAIDQLDIFMGEIFGRSRVDRAGSARLHAPMARRCVRWQCLTQFYFRN